jgi:hypothetical protein
MSVKIDNTKITMTRGDTLLVAVSMVKDGEDYLPTSGDVVRFAVKNKKMTMGNKEYSDPEPIILKNIPIATMVLELEPEDTKNLSFGEYVYDIEITFANGRVDTFITNSPFILAPEVH